MADLNRSEYDALMALLASNSSGRDVKTAQEIAEIQQHITEIYRQIAALSQAIARLSPPQSS